jgi:hypothetical protein
LHPFYLVSGLLFYTVALVTGLKIKWVLFIYSSTSFFPQAKSFQGFKAFAYDLHSGFDFGRCHEKKAAQATEINENEL